MSSPGKKYLLVPFLVTGLIAFSLIVTLLFFQFLKKEKFEKIATLWEEITYQETALYQHLFQRKTEFGFLSQLIQDAPLPKIQKSMTTFIEKHPHFTALYYLDSNAHPLLKVFPSKDSLSTLRSEHVFLKLIQRHLPSFSQRTSQTMLISPPFLYPSDKNSSSHSPVMIFANPLFSAAQAIQNILVGELDLNPLFDTLRKIPTSFQGKTLLLRRDGVLMLHPETSKEWGSEPPPSLHLRSEFQSEHIWKILSGKPGAFGSLTALLGVYVPYLPDPMQANLHWTLLHILHPKVFYDVIFKNRFEMVLIITILMLSSLIFLFTYNRYLKAEKQLEQTRTDFIAVLTHDLKSPLATLQIGLKSLFHMLPQNNAKAEKLFENTAEAINRMSKVTHDYLELAKLESGKMPFEFRKISVKNLILKTISLFEDLATQQHVSLQTKIDPTLPEIEADEAQLGRALQNLISNALKHSPSHKTVTIHALHNPHPKTVEIHVGDQGPGIPPDKFTTLFSKYEQINRRDIKTGTGLGLPIVKEIIQAHHGEISVKSELGQGSLFIIKLKITMS